MLQGLGGGREGENKVDDCGEHGGGQPPVPNATAPAASERLLQEAEGKNMVMTSGKCVQMTAIAGGRMPEHGAQERNGGKRDAPLALLHTTCNRVHAHDEI